MDLFAISKIASKTPPKASIPNVYPQKEERFLGCLGWQKVINDTYFDLIVDVKKPHNFKGKISRTTLDTVGVSSYTADSVYYKRDNQDVSKSSDSILITFPLNGTVNFQQKKRELVCKPGQCFIELSNEPFKFFHDEMVQLQVIKIPLDKINSHRRLIEKYFAKPINTEQGSGRLLTYQINSALNLSKSLNLCLTEKQLLEQQILDLVVHTLLRPTLSVADSEVSSIKVAHLQHVEQFVKANLSNPLLSPKMVSQACHISERYLHLLFKDLPYTFSEWVKQSRLNYARQLIIKGMCSSIAEVGYQVGFADQSYFSRIYKKHFGYSPKNTPVS